MALPVIAISTSASCGHCRTMRGDGQPREPNKGPDGRPLVPGPITRGSYHFSPTFIRQLITGSREGTGPAKWRLYEFYYPTLGAKSITEVIEINEYTLAPGTGITRVTYSPETKVPSGKAPGVLMSMNGESKKTLLPGTEFNSWVLARYPKDITRLIYFFPGWLYVSGSTWNGAINGTKRLFGHVSSCKLKLNTSTPNPFWTIDAENINPSSEDPLENAIVLGEDHPKLKEADNTPVGAVPASAGFPAVGVVRGTSGCTMKGYRIVPL